MAGTSRWRRARAGAAGKTRVQDNQGHWKDCCMGSAQRLSLAIHILEVFGSWAQSECED